MGSVLVGNQFTDPKARNSMGLFNSALTSFASAFNTHTHDPGPGSNTTNFGGSISQTGPSWISQYAVTGPGGTGWSAMNGTAAIPADPSQTALDPATITISAGMGVHAELAVLRGAVAKFSMGAYNALLSNIPSGPMPVLNPSSPQVGTFAITSDMTANSFIATTTTEPPFNVSSDLMVTGLNSQFVGGFGASTGYGTNAYSGLLLPLNSNGLFPVDSLEYDMNEQATWDDISLGGTIINTLNRLRYRIVQVQTAAGVAGAGFNTDLTSLVQSISAAGYTASGPVTLAFGPGMSGGWTGNTLTLSATGTGGGTTVNLVGDAFAQLPTAWVATGGLVTGSGNTLSAGITVPALIAYIPNGPLMWNTLSSPLTITNSTSPALSATSDNYIDWNGGSTISSITIRSCSVNGTPTGAASNVVTLAKVTTNSTNITGITDLRQLNFNMGLNRGFYAGSAMIGTSVANIGASIFSVGNSFSITSTGIVTVGLNGPGIAGTTQILPNPSGPVSSRLTYGTDGTGWQFRIGKNQGGTITDQFTILDNGKIGIGNVTGPTATLHLPAATGTSSGQAPLKIGHAAYMTTPEADSIENDGNNLYYTDKNATRHTLSMGNTGYSFNYQTASYTLVASDAGNIIKITSSSPVNVNIPTTASVGFAIGTEILVVQGGSGQITFNPASGVTILSNSTGNATSNQYSVAGIIKQDNSDNWIAFGDIV